MKLNLVTRSHAQVRTDINFLSRSFDRPTIEESFGKMGPTKLRNREINFGKGTQGKRKQKYENHIKVL